MNTQTFLNILKNNLNKELLFEYAPDKFVSANYHITEIKNLTIDAVDCGGKANSWKETVVQLWENPLEIGKRRYMTTTKAVEIFDRVNSINPLLLNTLVKIENDQSIMVKLHADSTQCKAASTNICCTKKNIEKAHSITKEPVICC
jgi:hypothetical protein